MKAEEIAVRYMISVWDEVMGNWRERPDHVAQKFLEAEKEMNDQKVREHIDSVLPDEKPRNKVLIIIQKCSCFDIDALVSEYTYYYDESAINEAKDKCRSLMKETDTISCDMYLADDEKISCT